MSQHFPFRKLPPTTTPTSSSSSIPFSYSPNLHPSLSTNTTTNTNTSSNTSSNTTNTTNTTTSKIPPTIINYPSSPYYPYLSNSNALFGNEYICDDLINHLYQQLLQINPQYYNEIEIEAKIGNFINKLDLSTHQPIYPRKLLSTLNLLNYSSSHYNNHHHYNNNHPNIDNNLQLLSECIFNRTYPIEFQSQLFPYIFKYLNNKLNERYKTLQDEFYLNKYNGNILKYEKRNELDNFYDLPKYLGGGSIRVTNGNVHSKNGNTDDKNGNTNDIIIIEKKRITNIDILSPNNLYDYRISINREIKMKDNSTNIENNNTNIEGNNNKFDKFDYISKNEPNRYRQKERISYIFGLFKIDLTSVENSNYGGTPNYGNHNNATGIGSNKNRTYEIEIECNDCNYLFHLLNNNNKEDGNNNNKYLLIQYLNEFVGLIRMINRVCNEAYISFQQQQQQQHYYHQQQQQQLHYQQQQQQQQLLQQKSTTSGSTSSSIVGSSGSKSESKSSGSASASGGGSSGGFQFQPFQLHQSAQEEDNYYDHDNTNNNNQQQRNLKKRKK